MKCDKCGEDTKFEARTEEGVLCAKCLKAKKKKPPKLYPTKDKLIKFARKYVDSVKHYTYYVMEYNGKRMYTDGRIMLSQMTEYPAAFTLTCVVNEDDKPEIGMMPNFERVIPKGKPDCSFELDKDFYMYAKVMAKEKGSYVDIDAEGIHVGTEYSDMSLNYRESDTSGVKEKRRVNLEYILDLKPKKVECYDKLFWFRGSYEKFVDEFPIVLVAGMYEG